MREVILKAGEKATATDPHRPLDVVAQRKAGRGEAWEVYAWEVLGDDYLMTGGIPNDGSRSRKWRGVKGDRVIVTRDEKLAEIARFESETGKCSQCGGCGESVCGAGIVMDHGVKKRGLVRVSLRACSRCKGSGIAPAAEPQPDAERSSNPLPSGSR